MKKSLLIIIFISTLCRADTFTINTFNFPPYIQKKDGIVIDIIKELFNKSNIKFNIKFLPQSRAIINAQNLDFNLVTPIQRSQEREANYKWVGPILITQTAFFTLPSSDLKIDVLEDIFKEEVLVIRGSVDEEYLKSFGIKTQSVRTNLQNVNKLKVKRAKIWATDTISASYYSKEIQLEIKKQLVFLTTLRSLAFNINTSDEIIDLLNKNLEEMYTDGTIRNILLDYSNKYDVEDILKFLSKK